VQEVEDFFVTEFKGEVSEDAVEKSLANGEAFCIREVEGDLLVACVSVEYGYAEKLLERLSGHLQGYFNRHLPHLYISYLAVKSDWQRLGLGTELMKYLETLYSRYILLLELREDNEKARYFYHSLDYDEILTYRNVKGEIYVVMSAEEQIELN